MKQGHIGTLSWKVEGNDLIFYPKNGHLGQVKIPPRSYVPEWAGTYDIVRFEEGSKAGKFLDQVFMNVEAKIIDLTNLDTSETKHLNYTFFNTKCDTIVFDNVDFSNVVDFNHVFQFSKIQKLDLTKLNLTNVINMESAFRDANIASIRLPDLPKLENANYIFTASNIDTLDLGNNIFGKIIKFNAGFFRTKVNNFIFKKFMLENLSEGAGLFSEAKIKDLDVTKIQFNKNALLCKLFNRTNIHDLKLGDFIDNRNVDKVNYFEMFAEANIVNLDLSNFPVENVTEHTDLFKNAKIDNIIFKSKEQLDKLNQLCPILY